MPDGKGHHWIAANEWPFILQISLHRLFLSLRSKPLKIFSQCKEPAAHDAARSPRKPGSLAKAMPSSPYEL
jgi:hypothetical protein